MTEPPRSTQQSQHASVLAWDSDFFGFLIARVSGSRLSEARVAAVKQWCVDNGVRCLYFLADGGDRETVRLAEDHDFRLVDFRITLSSRLKAHSVWASSGVIRPVQVDDIPSLQRIAAISYTDSRFFFDSNFPRERSKALYETWIQKSCNDYADTVLVAIVQEKPVGYISCHLEPEARGQIGLIGVDPMLRGMGIGRQLVTEALSWFIQHGVHTLTVVTQGRNVTALRLYERCGFLTDSTQLWYHKWFCDEVTGKKL